MTTSKAAPGDLELIRQFVNTLDIEEGSDAIETANGLKEFLAKWHEPGGQVDGSDVADALATREAIRSLMLANHNEDLDDAAIQRLNDIARRLPVVIQFASDGTPEVSPSQGGTVGFLAKILSIILVAHAEGNWVRMKACLSSDCQWAFYDYSKNLSRSWCSMAVCGNRMKTRAFRQRKGDV